MPALIQNASREEFGDYQINGMMAAAKNLKENPRELAENLKQALESDETFKEIVSKIEIAGPGFLNLNLKSDFLISKSFTKKLKNGSMKIQISRRKVELMSSLCNKINRRC